MAELCVSAVVQRGRRGCTWGRWCTHSGQGRRYWGCKIISLVL